MSHLVLHTRVVRGSGGGPDKTILNSPRYLRDDGYPMLCAYMRHPRDPGFAELEGMAARWGAPLVGVDDRGPFDLGLKGRLRRLCLEHRPAIWHGHDYKSNYLGLRLRRRPPMLLITTVHGWGVQGGWRTPLYYALDRLLVRRYDEVICVSRDLHRQCLAHGVRPQRCWLLENAIDTEEYRRRAGERQAIRERLGTRPQRLVVGTVGRLSLEKAVDELIRVVGSLIAKGVDLELWVVGDGPRGAALGELAVQLGIADRVRLLGYRSDTLALYQGMDLFALASRREGLPNAVLEAMAVELPVVCTRVGGLPQLVRQEENGLLVDPGARDELATAVRRLAEDAGLRRRLAAAARRTIEERHGMRQRMERMKEIYDVALGLRARKG